MIDSFIIGAYWGSRAETLEQVVNKSLQTFKRLSNLDAQFLNWYEGGMSRKKALEKKFSLDSESLKKLCLGMVKKGELDEQGFAKNGFSFSLWTGHKDEEASNLSFTVGDTFKTNNLSNCCVLNIPFEGEAKERLLQLEKAKAIISILVDIWEPEYAVLTSDNLRDRLNILNQIGWITYQKAIRQVPKLGSKIIYEMKDSGHMFYLNLANNSSYDYDLLNELQPLKEIINK